MIKLWNRGRPEAPRDLTLYASRQRRMVEDQIRARGLAHPEILKAMASLPRHRFVPADLLAEAHSDRALPIGLGQTISQPYMVAIMTEALRPWPGARVLEVGTGSGYQAALLALLGCNVWTIERLAPLSLRAETQVSGLGLANVTFRVGDGTLGWLEEAPFDGIIVTAGAPRVPVSLERQLADGGRLVIPAGGWTLQELVILERRGDQLEEMRRGACAFVPLVGEDGWKP